MKVKNDMACFVCSAFILIFYFVTNDHSAGALGIFVAWIPAMTDGLFGGKK